jgi:hypothetical protein
MKTSAALCLLLTSANGFGFPTRRDPIPRFNALPFSVTSNCRVAVTSVSFGSINHSFPTGPLATATEFRPKSPGLPTRQV